MTMTQEQAVGQQRNLRNYTVTYVMFTAAGQVPHVVTVQAHDVKMDAEYVKLFRVGEGVVFAVPRDRFASLTLIAARSRREPEFPGG